MCGIVGYVGNRRAAPVVLAGLQSLEYRGYDSAGFASVDAGNGLAIKQIGRVEGLKKLVEADDPKAKLAIGHTRWATHGSPTIHNAHPHSNSDNTIFVAHNGIIENYVELKDKLQAQGYNFVSETDTEVIPHLIDYYYRQSKDFSHAFKEALSDLRGAYGIAAITTHHPDTLFAARLSSPLVIGVGKSEYILASDPSAVMEHTKKVIFLDDYDIATITGGKCDVHNTRKGRPIKHQAELLDYDNTKALLGDYPHFMLKEINEAPATIRSATLGRTLASQNLVKLGGLEIVAAQLKYIDRIVIVACGTSYYAGLVGEYLIEELAGIPVEVQLASEFKYKKEPFSRSTALLAISQSGETADTIAALKKVEDYGVLRHDNTKALLGDYPHFMLKEINEAPATIRSATLGRTLASQNLVKLGGLEIVAAQLKYIDRIVIVACGTSYYAGLVGEYLIEELAGIPVEVQLASEFKYKKEPFSRSTALLAISQSGETADTIAALKKVEDYGVLRLGIVNSVGSTIARMTDAGVYCHAGPEQAVASTKAFIAQVTVLAQIALHLGNQSNTLFKPLLKELEDLPAKAQAILDDAENIKAIAKKYAHYRDFLFIGRGYGFPGALEGALKLKEVSYIHAEGYAAGEMKHGPLAMIDKDFPTFALATNSEHLDKTYSNIEEIRARKGPVVAIATKGNKTIKKLCGDVIYIPDTLEQTQPILQAVATQLFAYYIAVERGFDVDRPRNLAKSVTVE